ncbi:MAG: DUF86 domain-containing protein [Brevinematales bacterium]|nr:DUF86 domain-containing protein [Brevinematales bacterium]
MLDKNSLSIQSILEAIGKIEVFTASISTADEFFSTQSVFDACLMNFIVIGEMIARMDEGFKKKYPVIEWDKIKALRNIVAHEYFGVEQKKYGRLSGISSPN